MITLKAAMPHEFAGCEYDSTPARRHEAVEVKEQHGCGHDEKPWPGPHKHVHYWVVLRNGKAVGWNENPSHGWSFPVIKVPA